MPDYTLTQSSPPVPKEPQDPKKYTYLDKGYTSTVYLIPGTTRVVKSFPSSGATTHYPAELQAYTRFTSRGSHPNLLTFFGPEKTNPSIPYGLILSLASKGTLHEHLYIRRQHTEIIQAEEIWKWATQAASGLQFAHECGVFHSDIHLINFLLDERDNLKVADWAGASMEGSTPWSYYRTTHHLYLPGQEEEDEKGSMVITTASEIFALGSAFYMMVMGRDLFQGVLEYEKDKKEIVKRIREGRFPDLEGLSLLGDVVGNCWRRGFRDMGDVLLGIKEDARSRRRVWDAPEDEGYSGS